MPKITEIKDMESLIQRMLSVSSDSVVYRKIATYIEQNHMQIIFMTAGQLANELSISQGSVSKFCMSLGYRGYAEFLRSLQKLVGKNITAPERYKYTSSSENHTDDVIEKEIENLNMLKDITSTAQYQELVQKIAQAEEVILLSARMSATLLPYMKYTLEKLRDHVRIVTPEQSEWEYLAIQKAHQNILVLAIGLPRYPRILVDKLEEINELGYDIGVITDSRFSPLCQYGSIQLYIPTTVSSIFDLYSTPIAFINLLVSDVSKKIPEMQERLAVIEEKDVKNKTYYI